MKKHHGGIQGTPNKRFKLMRHSLDESSPLFNSLWPELRSSSRKPRFTNCIYAAKKSRAAERFNGCKDGKG